MKIKTLIFALLLTGCYLPSLAQTSSATNDEPVTTMVLSGHYISAIDVNANQQYALTTDGTTIALWDLGKRRVVRQITMPNKDVRFHPLNASWIMVRPVNDIGLSGETVYYTYNLFTGKRMGVKKGKDVPAKNKRMEDFVLEREAGLVTIRSRKTGEVVGTLNGCYGLTGARLALDNHDSLLVQSGLRPLVWDLKNARFVGTLPYIDFLKQDEGLYFRDNYTVPIPKKRTSSALRDDLYFTSKNNYQYGYRSFYEAYFTDNGDVLLGGYNDNITRWSTDGRLLETIPTDGAPVFSFTDNGQYRVAATYQGLNMGKMPDGKLKDCKGFNKGSDYKLLYQVSPIFRKKYFVTGGDDLDLVMGKMGDPDFRKKLLFIDTFPMCYDIDTPEQTILLSGEFARLQEVPIDNPKQNFKYDTSPFKSSRADCCLYLDEEWIAAGCNDGVVGFWKRGTKQAQQVAYAHRGGVTDLKLARNRQWMLSADWNGMIRIWDARTHAPIMDLFHLGVGNDYVFVTPDNYYKASKGAYDMIHFAKGMQVLSFEQFDLVYNRPDIVLQRLGQPQEKTRAYYLAWKKRLRRMGYDEDRLSGEMHAPELTVSNRKSLPKSTAQREVALIVRATDSKYKLERLFVSLNGVPLHGKRGANIAGRQTSVYEDTLRVQLCQGNNRIDISCMNDKGVESYREQVDIYCEAPAAQPKLFVAAIGVSRYAQNGFNLNYAAKDATDFATLMEQSGKDRFSAVECIVLADEAFSQASLPRLKEFFGQAGRDDVVMLFYAGHGVLSRDMDYFLGTYAMDFDRPQAEGVDYEAFESCLEHTESIHRFCFVDACHSGELDKEDYLADNVVTKPAGKLVFRNAGYGLREVKGQGVKQVQALFNELFVDVRWGMGATVLSSAGGMEVALEGNDWKNGLFTWCLKKGIAERAADLDKDGKISTSELTAYVSQEVNRLSDGLQTPSVRQDNRLQDFVIVE